MAGLQPLRHDNVGPQLDALAAVLAVLSGAFVLLRVFLKLRQRRGLWWDDYILILAYVRSLSLAAPRPRNINSSFDVLGEKPWTLILVCTGHLRHHRGPHFCWRPSRRGSTHLGRSLRKLPATRHLGQRQRLPYNPR